MGCHVRHTLGLNFFIKTLLGISNSTYGMKKMTRAVLYFILFAEARPSSSDNPKTLALAMLTRSRKARR